MLVVNKSISVPLKELDFTFSRSSGPGGQNVNKVNTKVTMHWSVAESDALPEPVRRRFLEKFRNRVNNDGQVVLASQRYRDQGRNVADCMDKLREMLAEAATPPRTRKKTRPTRGSKERRLREKRATTEKKQRRSSPRLD
ncbi:MAG: aminoacyl-tRNA hydrolase [Planctomycetes bacterium]|nr:aminoacyl-tRNA hydrolase [Planctomycetota bacterium]